MWSVRVGLPSGQKGVISPALFATGVLLLMIHDRDEVFFDAGDGFLCEWNNLPYAVSPAYVTGTQGVGEGWQVPPRKKFVGEKVDPYPPPKY